MLPQRCFLPEPRAGMTAYAEVSKLLDEIPGEHREAARKAISVVEAAAAAGAAAAAAATEGQVKSLTDHVQSLKEVQALLKKDNAKLLQELSQVKAVFATRPLIELGLQNFCERRADLAEYSWTALSHAFLRDHVFNLQKKPQWWVNEKVDYLNNHFGWGVHPNSPEFHTCLWEVYGRFSEKYHGIGDVGKGFVVTGTNPLQTAAAVILISALRYHSCLGQLQITISPPDVTGQPPPSLCIDQSGELQDVEV